MRNKPDSEWQMTHAFSHQYKRKDYFHRGKLVGEGRTKGEVVGKQI
jgi:hypothetical protein